MKRIPRGLKVGALIEVTGTDWTTDGTWREESKAMGAIGLPTIQQPGYFLGLKDGIFCWAATRIVWAEDYTPPDVKYIHYMALAAIQKIRRL